MKRDYPPTAVIFLKKIVAVLWLTHFVEFELLFPMVQKKLVFYGISEDITGFYED